MAWNSTPGLWQGSFSCDECGFASRAGARARRGPDLSRMRKAQPSAVPRCSVMTRRPDASVEGAPNWLEEAREALVSEGDYLAFEDDERFACFLQEGWTRIGRSLSAHVRFDDPTVSRRHALVYRDDSGARILDDRSLNGSSATGNAWITPSWGTAMRSRSDATPLLSRSPASGSRGAVEAAVG